MISDPLGVAICKLKWVMAFLIYRVTGVMDVLEILEH